MYLCPLGIVCSCCIISLCYKSLHVSIGLDETSFSGRGSSPLDIPPALKVPSADVPSAQRHFLKMMQLLEENPMYVGGMLLSFSGPRWCSSRFSGITARVSSFYASFCSQNGSLRLVNDITVGLFPLLKIASCKYWIGRGLLLLPVVRPTSYSLCDTELEPTCSLLAQT